MTAQLTKELAAALQATGESESGPALELADVEERPAVSTGDVELRPQ